MDLKISDFPLIASYDLQKQELLGNGWSEYPENVHIAKFWCAESEYVIEKLWKLVAFCVF